ncbi:FAD-dependent oxidoreductase [Streptomyces sp. CRN 30]|uniref:NAD(P)/FAD-dependent oxidoreductase n=1 Tax=Streptomyces sp. CRN 30 TaxID=3075613 RepID=UPI002A83B9BA|nr:FAD-dependent oxidoreductase [Streptomyces sp. CRN 30]
MLPTDTGADTRADVAVVGTGVIGLATAWEAARRGLRVHLVGPCSGAHQGQASRAAGAMLAPFSEVAASDSPERVALEVGERVAARNLYDAWLPSLREATGRPLALTPGMWVVATTGGRGDARELDAIADAALGHGHVAERHDPGEVPGLSPARSCTAHGALWLPGEATVDSGELMAALTDALHAHAHVEWTDAEATGLRPSDGGGLTVTCAGAPGTPEVAAPRVVLAVGVGLTDLVAGSGELDLALPPMLAGKGVSALLRDVPVELPAAVRTPMRDFACGMHLVPRADGTVYLGATNRLSPSAAVRFPLVMELADLLREAGEELSTKLYEGQLVGTRVGYRPFTLDHLPLVGPTADPRVLIASGTYRNGMLLAPRLAEMIADHLTLDPVAAHPFDPTRPITPHALPETLERWLPELVDLFLPPSGTPTPMQGVLADLLHQSLRGLAADGDHPRGAEVRRTWQQAPVPEALWSLLVTYLR